MNKLWPTLFSLLFLSSCVNNPEVEVLSKNQLLLSYKQIEAVYNKDNGGWIEHLDFHKKRIFNAVKDTFPNSKHSYRLSPTSIHHDNESVITKTFHDNPKLNVSSSVILKENTLELNWWMKNSGLNTLEGRFKLQLELALDGTLSSEGTHSKLELDNGFNVTIEHDGKLKFEINNNKLIISDLLPRSIDALHRSSQKISFKFER